MKRITGYLVGHIYVQYVSMTQNNHFSSEFFCAWEIEHHPGKDIDVKATGMLFVDLTF